MLRLQIEFIKQLHFILFEEEEDDFSQFKISIILCTPELISVKAYLVMEMITPES